MRPMSAFGMGLSVGFRFPDWIIQVTVNNVTIRVVCFICASACLLAMILKEVFTCLASPLL